MAHSAAATCFIRLLRTHGRRDDGKSHGLAMNLREKEMNFMFGE